MSAGDTDAWKGFLTALITSQPAHSKAISRTQIMGGKSRRLVFTFVLISELIVCPKGYPFNFGRDGAQD
jgi:hypothetical protein